MIKTDATKFGPYFCDVVIKTMGKSPSKAKLKNRYISFIIELVKYINLIPQPLSQFLNFNIPKALVYIESSENLYLGNTFDL